MLFHITETNWKSKHLHKWITVLAHVMRCFARVQNDEKQVFFVVFLGDQGCYSWELWADPPQQPGWDGSDPSGVSTRGHCWQSGADRPRALHHRHSRAAHPPDDRGCEGLFSSRRGTTLFPRLGEGNTRCRLCLPSQLDTGKTFQVRMRFDTDVELAYFHHGGILNYMIRKMSQN